MRLSSLEDEAGIPPRRVNTPGRFRRLLQTLHRTTGQPAAVLVDGWEMVICGAVAQGRKGVPGGTTQGRGAPG